MKRSPARGDGTAGGRPIESWAARASLFQDNVTIVYAESEHGG
jgi:hypothetical protein